MRSEIAQNSPAEKPSGVDPLRRLIVGALAGAATLAGSADVRAEIAKKKGAQEEELFNAYNRTKQFTNSELDGTPWKAGQLGNFDVNDPIENRLARLKMTNNLIGKRTYIPMLTRLVIGRDQLPGGVVLGAAGMFTWQLQEPDAAEFGELPEGTAVMRSMFTATYLNPETMEPVKTLKNPVNGKMMALEDYAFVENFLTFPKGGSRFVEERQFSDDDPDKPKMSLIKPWGDELVLYAGGTYSKPGDHQPRFTENMWRCKKADVMDPNKTLIEMSYTFMGANKAFEKPWMGYDTNDNDMLFSLAIGQKVHRPEDIPDFHKRVLVENHPDRI
ncbi:MAG: hypothetical protein AAF607_02415 [Pseudomonadota bacterium]